MGWVIRKDLLHQSVAPPSTWAIWLKWLSGKVMLYDADGKKPGSVSDKKYLNNINISDVSPDEKKMAFVLDKSLIVGDFEAIKTAVK